MRVAHHDANGNRLALITPTETLSGVYDDQDRLLEYGPYSYGYGASGDLRTKRHTGAGELTTYGYDALGNLLDVALPDGTIVSYVVDGQGRRVGKRVDGGLQQAFLYRDRVRVAAELDGSGALVSQFVYAGNEHSPSYMRSAGQIYRLIKDQVGSIRLVVNTQTGEVAQELGYDEFGNVLQDTNPGFQPFGFAGGLYDADTGLVRFGARDYDPHTGRWTNKDPILFRGGQANLYVYVGNDPINWIDPLGLAPDCEGNECFSGCMDAQGSDWALGALGLSGPFASIPKVGKDLNVARHTGASRATNIASWGARGLKAAGANGAATTLRQVGRRLNPIANVVAVGAGSYLATSALICALDCASQ